jgi:hypothetical protein
MALADERRSASAHMLSAADGNAQKSKPNGGKTNRKNCCDQLAAAAAKSTTPRFK